MVRHCVTCFKSIVLLNPFKLRCGEARIQTFLTLAWICEICIQKKTSHGFCKDRSQDLNCSEYCVSLTGMGRRGVQGWKADRDERILGQVDDWGGARPIGWGTRQRGEGEAEKLYNNQPTTTVANEAYSAGKLWKMKFFGYFKTGEEDKVFIYSFQSIISQWLFQWILVH